MRFDAMRFKVVLACVVCAAACGGDSTPAPDSITVTAASANALRGADVQFTATATYGSTTKDVTTQATWTSSAPGVATVNAAGLTHGVAEGQSTIGADFGGHHGELALTVQDYNRVFITSVSGKAKLGDWADAGGKVGLAAADAICQARARAAGLTGTFVAWLSDSTSDAYCRVHGLTGKTSANCGESALPVHAGPWVSVDGVPFAPTIDKLIAGQVYAPVRLTELGQPTTDDVYTATQNGVLYTTGMTSCSDWTSDVAAQVYGGEATGGSSTWEAYTILNCSGAPSAGRLLCMETGPGLAFTIPVPTGKIAFISSAKGTGNLASWNEAGVNTGLAAGDAICRALAAARGLANASKFKAWLSDSTYAAKDRLLSDGPWYRRDGIKVADNKADLIDGALFSELNVTEGGDYLSSNLQIYAWTGTQTNGTASFTIGPPVVYNTCTDWTSAAGAVNGRQGLAFRSAYSWTNAFNTACSNATGHVYCFEDQ